MTRDETVLDCEDTYQMSRGCDSGDDNNVGSSSTAKGMTARGSSDSEAKKHRVAEPQRLSIRDKVPSIIR